MSLFKPKYKNKFDKWVHSRIWWYEFLFAGRLIRESAKTNSKVIAKEAEKQRRRELELGFNGLGDGRPERIRTIAELAQEFLRDYLIRQPKSASFASHAVGHVSRLLGGLMAVDIAEKTVTGYQTDRRKEGAAPKTINEEVGFLLRFLPPAHAGALRESLRQQKKLKLKVDKSIGKAYSDQEKKALVSTARAAPRSKAIHMATMLAFHAGMRDKEIRNLQWKRLNLEARIVTVGESKTDAGTGRTVPLNADLYSAAIEYAKWYTARFEASQPDWYVFPFGKPVPNDPTRPQTSLKTAWRNVRRKGNIEGRFHDTRHTFVTDLAESGAGDEVIRDMAGHVSRDMLKHYSHIRTEAKRKAVQALVSGESVLDRKQNNELATVESVLQDSLQVTSFN